MTLSLDAKPPQNPSDALAAALLAHAQGEILSAPFKGLVPAFETQIPRPARPQEGLHGALSTLVLSTLNAVIGTQTDHAAPEQQFAADLMTLSAAHRWRGPHKEALRQVGEGLEKGTIGSVPLVKNKSNPALGLLLPFSFLPPERFVEQARSAGKCASVLTRHRQVASAMGLFMGGLHTLVFNPSTSSATLFGHAKRYANQVREEMETQWGTKAQGNALQTEGALGMLLAQAEQAEHPRDLLPPPGIDARDEPQRLACVALLGFQLSPEEGKKWISEILRLAAHVDVLLPLVEVVLAVQHGAQFVEQADCQVRHVQTFEKVAQALQAQKPRSFDVTAFELSAEEEKAENPSGETDETSSELNVDKHGQLSFL